MKGKNLNRWVSVVVATVVVVSLGIAIILITATNGAVRVEAMPSEVLPIGTKVPPTVTPTPEPTATPEPTLAPTVMPSPTEIPTPTELPSPTPVPDLGITPERLRIPAIGVDAHVEHVGKTADGAMDVPKDVWNVAWYEPGTKPGNPGSAVIAGHLDGYNLPAAVFFNLRKLQPGNKIYISDSAGKELVYEVFQSQVFSNNPTTDQLNQIFGFASESHLNLITCNGTWDANKQNYSERLVVFSKQVNS